MSQRQRSHRFIAVPFAIILIAAFLTTFTTFTVTAKWKSNSPFLVSSGQPDVNATFTVTNTNNSGPGSLRRAARSRLLAN